MHYILNSFFLVLLFYPGIILAQVELSGSVNDANGEKLSFSNVLVLPDSAIVPADDEGNFRVKTVPGAKAIIITYTGYQTFKLSFNLHSDTTIVFTLSPGIGQLDEVTINANRYSQELLVQSTRTGTTILEKDDITAIPALGGEADVIKTLQLLPGMVRGVEGSSDLFVRGGAADQNLVLLDGATIYNTSHLFGFLSVFNTDILEKVEAVKGGFPARYGGRLSSIIDITSNNRIAKKTTVSGDIGLIASRLYVEQPLIKEKASIWLAGRRTYIDHVVKLIGEELPYYFYDLNGKFMFKPGKYDQIDVSYYSGEDILDIYRDRDNDGHGFTSTFGSGNSTQTIQWKHWNRNSFKSQLTITRTAFEYKIRNAFDENELIALSDIEDYSAKFIIEKDSVWKDSRITAGVEWTNHEVSPNIINTEGSYTQFAESNVTGGKTAREMAAHIQQEWSLSKKLVANVGFRGSMALVQSKSYFTPEPRFSIRYSIQDNESFKFSYSRMAQYMHRISNSAVSTPTDIWYPVTDSIKPQTVHQVALAWQKFYKKRDVFVSAEVYHKTMDQLIGYEEGTNLFLNTDFESKLIQGRGEAYGLELLLRKEAGKLTGWLSYSLSWSKRQFDEINDGNWFKARYDRRHNGALVMQYKVSKRLKASMVWEFISGARFTPIVGQYVSLDPTQTGVDLIPIFSSINAVKLSDTHRLDLGLKYSSKPASKFSWHWFIGVNNLYNRANPVGIIIEEDETDGSLKYAQPGLFGLLPFISYGFRF